MEGAAGANQAESAELCPIGQGKSSRVMAATCASVGQVYRVFSKINLK